MGEKNKVTNEVNLKNWVDSHSAQEIREANLARQLLKRKYDIQVGPTIRDPRFPKPVMNGYAAYVKSRYHAPEYEGVSPTDRLIKIGQEWKKLSPEQRKVSSGKYPLWLSHFSMSRRSLTQLDHDSPSPRSRRRISRDTGRRWRHSGNPRSSEGLLSFI